MENVETPDIRESRDRANSDATKPDDTYKEKEFEQPQSDLTRTAIFPKALERRVRIKLDWNIIPLVTALYMLSVLDRSNIGNARIAGMSTDLNLTGDRYEWLLTIFYIPCTIPGKLAYYRYSIRMAYDSVESVQTTPIRCGSRISLGICGYNASGYNDLGGHDGLPVLPGRN